MLEIGFDSSLLTSSSDWLSAVCAAEEGTCKKAKSVKRTSDRMNGFFTRPPIHRGSLLKLANVAGRYTGAFHFDISTLPVVLSMLNSQKAVTSSSRIIATMPTPGANKL
jgi:hypothetical protein